MSDIDNGQHWLDRNRPPRVQITYDVEIGNAIEKKELPLVVGILADLGGMPNPSLAERKFIEIDRDNFDTVLKDVSPTVSMTLSASTLNISDPSAAGFNANLSFVTIDDFSPLNIVKNTPELNALYVNRQQLRDMLARMDGNVPLEAALLKAFPPNES